MGRQKGDKHYWDQVTIEENGKRKCKHCDHPLNGSFTRIKAHIDRTKGKGVAICSVDRGRVHNASNSSNPPHQVVNTSNALQVANEMTAGGSINPQNNTQSIALLRGFGAEHAVNGSFQSEMSELNKLVSDLTSEEEDIKGQLQWLESRGKKRKSHVDTWLNELQDLKKRAVDMNNSLEQFGLTDLDDELEMEQELEALRQKLVEQSRKHKEIQHLTEKIRKHKEWKPLVLSNEFVGFCIEENIKKMWKLLGDDKVFIIGIHGMGGVGKTFLATHMENEVKRKETSKNVFWITVSRDFSIFKLQGDIAERMGVKLSGDDDERTRATILSLALETRVKAVLILDGVWKYIDLQKVGIPLKENGIKLIITSRLKHVCQQMDCLPDNTITVRSLWDDEAWELFLLKLGHHGTPAKLPPEVENIARSVAERCYGLPIGISVMARTMKGKNSIQWWRHALNKLDNLEMEEKVLTVLRRSYDNLIEKDLQKCFLYCAQSIPPSIEKGDLTMKLVESGLLNGKRSLGKIFDEAHVILDKLIDHSLLLDGEASSITMHGLVRNMACHILNESHTYMVKSDIGLTKIPQAWEWTVDLEAVSLMSNRVEEIAEGTSPNCPRLSTLILSHNCISHIPECFFTHMNALTVLDLSHNKISHIPECFFTHMNGLTVLDLSDNRRLTSLPNSLSNLRSLTSLVLSGCSELEDIPPLGELQALSKLDISSCSILQVPEGLQNLINLKWLDLSRNDNLTLVPGCVLPGLTNMQYLDLGRYSSIKVEDVQGMSMLECFAGGFLDRDDYDRYVRNILDRGHAPETYHIRFEKYLNDNNDNNVDEDDEDDDANNEDDEASNEDDGYADGDYYVDDEWKVYHEFNCRSLLLGDCEELPYILLPRDLGELFVRDNKQWVCLCAALSSNGISSLEKIQISGCKKLENLFCLSSSCSLCININNVKSLDLYGLKSLSAICKEDVAQSLSTRGVFSNLTRFEIKKCHGIEKLLTPGLVRQLQNLVSISVSECCSMEEIFGVSNSGDDDSFNITLPKLTTLMLFCLPRLKTVCKGILVCGYKDVLYICDCPSLDRLPTIQVLCN